MSVATRRLPWGEGLLGLAPTQEDRSPVTGQLLFRGLSAKVGIFHGPIVKLCPHSTTGDHQLKAIWLTETRMVLTSKAWQALLTALSLYDRALKAG